MQSSSDHELDMEISVDGTPDVVVRGHSGDISIGTTDTSSIRIHADGFEPSHHPGEEEPLFTTQSGNQITIDTHRNHGMLHADLRIEVPVGSDLAVNTINGDVAVHGVRGPVDLTTVDGDIHVTHTEGSAKFMTIGGDVHAEHVNGTLSLQTTNGDVVVRHSALTRFNVHSMNGDFMIETPLARGEHYFAKTVNGDIQLWVPPDTGATVQMRSTNGEFHSDLPTEVINPSRRHWQGRINGGGANVELETLNGDVRIKQSGQTNAFESDASRSTPERPERLETPERPVALERPESPWMPEIPAMPSIPEMPELPESSESPIQNGEANAESASFDSRDEGTSSRRMYSAPDSIDVLARLERGEITVEEAMADLDALR